MTEIKNRGQEFAIAEAEAIEKGDMNSKFVEKGFDLLFALEGIKRFSKVPMIHRSSVLEHSSRVRTIAMMESSFAFKAAGIEPDFFKIQRQSQGHDLAELKTGDVPTPEKEKMTPEEREQFHEEEREAVTSLAHEYFPDEYADLIIDDWEELTKKESTEAQLITIADKWDALCEVISDIRSGNDTPEIDEVYERYIRIFKELDKYPMMQVLKKNPAFGLTNIPTLNEVKNLSKIDLNLLVDGTDGEAFYRRLYDPNLPNVYKYWLYYCVNFSAFDLGVFSWFKDAMTAFPLSTEMRFKLTLNKDEEEG